MKRKVGAIARGKTNMLDLLKGHIVSVEMKESPPQFVHGEDGNLEPSTNTTVYNGFLIGSDNKFVYLSLDDGMEVDLAVSLDAVKHVVKMEKTLPTEASIDLDSSSEELN